MMDSYVSFSNSSNLDLFPSFKSFHPQKTEQHVLPTESIAERQSTISIASESKPKEMNLKLDPVKKPTSSNLSVQCDICSVPISSDIVYRTHINGRKHQTNLSALVSKNPQYKPSTYEELCAKKPETVVVADQSQPIATPLIDNQTSAVPPLIPSKQLVCHVCNVTCNSQLMFDKHLIGRKHQVKMKLAPVNNPAPTVRIVPDNNPSSSNYCDVCSLQLKSENELTEHLAHPRHQIKVKDAEICAKAATELKINFDDYKITNSSTTEKNAFQYECNKCNKKMTDKVQLIYHLKSQSHVRLINQGNRDFNQRKIKQGRYQRMSGGAMGNNLNTRNPNAVNKPTRQSRPYPLKRPTRIQPKQEQMSENIFGAFDPHNQAYSSNKPSVQYDNIPSGYDGFFPKHSDRYNSETNRPRDFSSTSGYDYTENSDSYMPQTTNYSDHSNQTQQSWQYPKEPQYNQQQYSNPQADYTNAMYYPPQANPPPLPNYEQPPLPNYPPPPSQNYYSQNATYGEGNQIRTNNQYYPPSSFQH